MKVDRLPNALTLLRVFLIPWIVICFYQQTTLFLVMALILFVVAVFSDYLDGLLARKYNCISSFGTYMDPIADKMLILTMLFLFVERDVIPLWLALLFLFRELIVSAIRQLGAEKGELIGSNRMGKTKAILQMLLIFGTLIVLICQSLEMEMRLALEISLWSHYAVLLISFYFTIIFLIQNRALFTSSMDRVE